MLQIVPLGGGAPLDSYYLLNGTALQSIKSAIVFLRRQRASSRKWLFAAPSARMTVSMYVPERVDRAPERAELMSARTAHKKKSPDGRGFSAHQLLEARAGVEPA